MASLYSISVRRPVLATVMSLGIVIGGVLGLRGLGVREYPVTETPVISVSTSLRGANAEVIQNQVTEPLEESINGIAGIRSITSSSSNGSSRISVEFELGEDLDAVAAEVRDRVARARRRIPPEADEPVVSKSNADAQPVVFLTVSSDQRSLLELSDLAQTFFVERLQTIPGVASVDIWGDKRYAMRLYLDPTRMAAFGLTPTDVRAAVQAQNVELPGGQIEGDQTTLSIRPMMRLQTVEDFENLVLKAEGTTLVRMKDVGRVAIGAENERSILKRDGVPMVGVVLRPLPGANYIDMVDEFYARLALIERDLPDDVRTEVGFDNTRPIRASITEVEETIAIALALVVLILFLFLRDWRSTLVPLLVVPVSLVGAFGIMALAGFSVNVLTLLALVLAIGIVVDDAIVVLENIYVKVERGVPRHRAAIEGTREIFVAVVATTMALVVVFLPIIFQGGVVGALFREFGLTLAGAIAISAFAALTLTPMLSARILRRGHEHPWFYRKTEPFFVRLNDGYRRALDGFLRVRWLAFVVMAVCGGLVYVLFTSLESELAPMEDRAQLSVAAQLPQGTSYAVVEDYMDRLTGLVRAEVPEATGITTIVGGWGGSSGGRIIVSLTPADERERTQTQIAEALQRAVRALPGASVNIQEPATISTASSRGLPVQYVIQAPTLAQLQETLPRFVEAAQATGAFAFVRANLEFTNPELLVEVDRSRAQSLGIDPLDVAQTLQVALSEQRLGYFIRSGQQYEIIAQLEADRRDDPAGLRGLYVRSAAGTPILLENLVTVRESAAPPQLYRFNRFEAATVMAQPAPGVSLGAALDAMDAVADEVLPEGFSRDVTGQSRDFRESSGSLAFVFVLALVLIYLVLAAQFESFRDPFIIMLTVPLALVGALGLLWAAGATLNVFSQIGLVMLIGLVTKNGILIVEFARQRQEAGATVLEAAREGAAARFRPILMTSAATILGTLPIALALGAGAESRTPMGLAVIGGLAVGTLLSLFVVPAMYTFFAGEHVHVETEEEAAAPVAVTADGAAVLAGGDGAADGTAGVPQAAREEAADA
ncbi:MAG TPA: efflux RND transporter permease subunit [Rubricoccaceae bacterium]|nr:efflux RND transporter permease subunit [Rubricoccaceae bacterium]